MVGPSTNSNCLTPAYLRVALRETHAAVVELRALQEKAVHVRAVFRAGPEVCVFGHDFEVVLELVDGDAVLAREVLEDASEEALREVEAGEPVDGRLAFEHPLLEEVDALAEVFHVRGQRLETRVGAVHPDLGHFVHFDEVEGFFELEGEHDRALQRVADARQVRPDHLQQLVVPRQLLQQDDVHRLLAPRLVLLARLADVEGFGRLQYDLAHEADDLLRRAYRAGVFAALLGAAAALAAEQRVEQEVGFVEFFGDVRVGVEAVDAWRRVERHAVDEGEVLVVGVEVGHVVLVERGVELEVVVVREVALVVVFEQHLDESAVFVVRDAAAVVALGREVFERLQRELVGVLVDEDAQLRCGDAQVGLGELVGDVPA